MHFRAFLLVLSLLWVRASCFASCEDNLAPKNWGDAIAARIQAYAETFDPRERERFATELLDIIVAEDRALRLQRDLERNDDDPKGAFEFGPKVKGILMSLGGENLFRHLDPLEGLTVVLRYFRAMLPHIELSSPQATQYLLRLSEVFSLRPEGPPLGDFIPFQAFSAFADLFSKYRDQLLPTQLLSLEEKFDLEHALFSSPLHRSISIDDEPVSLRSLSGNHALDALTMVVNHTLYLDHHKTDFYSFPRKMILLTTKGALIELRNRVQRPDGLFYSQGDNCSLRAGARIRVENIQLNPQTQETVFKLRVVKIYEPLGETSTGCPAGSVFTMTKDQLIEHTLGFDSPLQYDP